MAHHEGAFVILAQAEEEYVQTAGGALEYRHAGRHFRSAQIPAPAGLIEDVFVAYLHGEDWTQAAPWDDVTDEVRREGRRSVGRVVLAILLLVAAGAFIAFIRSAR